MGNNSFNNNNKEDNLAMIAKGLIGAIPIAGPLAAEVIGNIIPNQRIDRISDYLKILDKKLEGISKLVIESKLKQEDFVDLFEDSLINASRALSSERKEYIASIIKNSIVNDDLSYIEEKKIMYIVSQLNDIEIIKLKHHTLIGQEQKQFFELHKEILSIPFVHIKSEEHEINQKAVYDTYKNNLVSLQLLNPRYKRAKNNELPQFDDKTGMMKSSGYNVTSLGRLILKYLELM